MSIIQRRIRSSGLRQSEHALLDPERVHEFRSTAKRLVAGEFDDSFVASFSIAALSLEAAAAKLRLGIEDQLIYAYWFTVDEGIALKWQLFIEHFSDLWYPSSDDLILTAQGASWAIEINHEELVRVFRLRDPFRSSPS